MADELTAGASEEATPTETAETNAPGKRDRRGSRSSPRTIDMG